MFHLPRGAIVLRFAIKSNSHVTLPRNLPRVLGRAEASDRAARAQGPSKYAIVRAMPSRNPIVGSHPSAARASAISGCRYVGSSDGSGLKTSPDREFDISMIVSGNARIRYSSGLPRLIGPVTSSAVSINAINPPTRSS